MAKNRLVIMEQKNIKYFKVNALPSDPCPNAIYYIPNGNGTDLDEYVTDKYGNPRKVRSLSPLEVNVNGVTSEVSELVFLNSNNVTFGISSNTITASVNPGGGGTGADFILSNSNGISFGTNASTVTASYTVPTDYVSSNQSSLFQLTANNTLFLSNDYTSHTHSQYLNTSQSSLFQQTSATSLITSNALNTSQSSLFQLTANNSLSLGTDYTTHTHSQYLNTSQSSLFQATSDNSLSLGTIYTTHTHSQYLNTSQSTLFITSQSVQPFALSGTNGSSTFSTLSLGTANGLTLYLTNGSLVGSYTDNGGAGGDGLNRISAGTQIANATTTVVFSNSNNVSFGMSNNSVVTASASYSQPTDYVSTAQSSLFQQTSLMSNYLGTTYTTHTHSQYLNTSQSSLFEQSSHTTIFLTTQSGQAYSAGNGSNTFQTLSVADSNGVSFSTGTQGLYATVRTNYASSDHSHGNPTLALTNVSGTTASNSAGFTLSLSVNPAGGADGYNILAAGTQTANTTGTVVLSNSNGITFGMSNSSVITASYTVPTDYVSTAQSSLFLYTSQSSLFEHTSHTSVFLTTQSGQAFSAGAASSTFQTLSFQDSNGVSFSNNAGGIRVSHALQFTSNTSAITANALNTSQSSLFQHTSATSAITSNALNTSQSSLFQHTSATSAITSNALHTSVARIQGVIASDTTYTSGSISFRDLNGISFQSTTGQAIQITHGLQYTSNTSAITSNALNTSQSSLFQHTSATSAITSNALNTSQSSLFQHTSATSAITSNALHSSVSRVINIVAATNNTGGGTASLSSNVSFSNANGMTFYTSAGSAIVASYTVPTLTNSSLTMQAGASTLSSVSRIAFVDSNGVSFGASTSNNGSITITATVATTYAASNHSHGNPTLALTNLTGTTASASNGFTLSLSAAAPGAGGGIVLANSQTTYTSGTVNLSGAGAITIQSTTGQSFQISVPATSSLSATGIISLSTNGSTVSIGADNILTMYATSNTTQSSTGTVSANSLIFRGAGAASVGISNGSIVISAPSAAAGNVTISAGTASAGLASLVFSNSNGVSFGLNGSTITASAVGGGGGIALANSQTTYTSGTAHLSGAGAITIQSTTGQSYIVSAPGSSSISGTGHVSISVNASTISIGAPSPAISGSNGSFSYSTLTFGNLNNVSFYTSNGSMVASINAAGGHTLSNFHHPENVWTSLGAQGQGSLSIKHMYVPFNVTGTQMNIGMSVSGATNTSATTASANVSLWIGIYTLNGSSLSLASSGSANNGFQWSQSASSTGNTSINSMRLMSVPINVNMTPGEYWMGVVISSATTYTSAGFTFYGGNFINNAATAAVFAPIGSGTTASSMAILFQGIYTAATSVGPSSMSKAHINFSSASNVQRANLYCQILNNTY